MNCLPAILDHIPSPISSTPSPHTFHSPLQCLTYSKVLSHTSSGVQTVEIDQAAIWRFLFLSGTFSVRLFVNEDRPNLQVRCDEQQLTDWLLHLFQSKLMSELIRWFVVASKPLPVHLFVDEC